MKHENDIGVIVDSILPKELWASFSSNEQTNSFTGVIASWANLAMSKIVVNENNTRIDQVSIEGEFDGKFSDLMKVFTGLGGRQIFSSQQYEPEKARPDDGGFAVIWPHAVAWGEVSKQGWGDITLLSMDKDLTKTIVEQTRSILKRRKSKRDFYMLCRDSEGGYNLTSIKSKPCPLIVENYEPSVIEEIKHVISELSSENPCGRVTLIEGPPGTGKTHLVEGLVNETDGATIILFPPSLLQEFSGPGIVSAFLSFRRSSSGPMVLVMEDGDACLAARASDNMGSISELLSLGDGILGKALDIRLVVTSNVRKSDVDSAILRPGRLCRRIAVENLSFETAAKKFDSIDHPELAEECRKNKKDMSLAEVYAKVSKGAVAPKTKKGIGF